MIDKMIIRFGFTLRSFRYCKCGHWRTRSVVI